MRNGPSTNATCKPGITRLIISSRHLRYMTVPHAPQIAARFPEASVNL